MITSPTIVILFIVAIATAGRVETQGSPDPRCTTAHELVLETGVVIPNGFSVVLTYHLGPFADNHLISFYSVDTSSGSIAKWSSAYPIDAIIVKGGASGAYIYTFGPPALGNDSMMRTTWSGQHRGAIEKIRVCFGYTARIRPNYVDAWYGATYAWRVVTHDPTCVTGVSGVPITTALPVGFVHTAVPDGYRLSGTFDIYNPDYTRSATVTSVTATLGWVDIGVSCTGERITPHSSVVCTFASADAALAENLVSALNVTVAVEPASGISPASLLIPVSWTRAPSGTELAVEVSPGNNPSNVVMSVVYDVDDDRDESLLVTNTLTGLGNHVVTYVIAADLEGFVQVETSICVIIL
jgi:hypothetical protein